jgi:hypothetical protein
MSSILYNHGLNYFSNPTLILPYDRGENQEFKLAIISISPVTGETQRGQKTVSPYCLGHSLEIQINISSI